MQVDRRARGLRGLLSEALATDESNVRFVVSSHDIPSDRQQIKSGY